MAFLGYTKQQAAAIHQTLLKAHLKRDADWPRLLKAITERMYEVTSPGTTLQDVVLYRGEVTRRLKAFTAALVATELAHAQLGEALRCHLDDHLPPVLRDDQFPNALNAMRDAAVRATTHRSPYGPAPTTGAPKNYAMRQAVYELLGVFEWATGIPPKVSSRHDGYAGNFYPFAVTALTPVFPAQELGSAIVTAYKEWRWGEQAMQNSFTLNK